MKKVDRDGESKHFWITAAPLYTAIVLVVFIFPIGRRFASVRLGIAVFPHDAILDARLLEWGPRSPWSPERRVHAWMGWLPAGELAGVAAAYAVVLVASFLVFGLGAAALARHFGADRYGGWVAGLILRVHEHGYLCHDALGVLGRRAWRESRSTPGYDARP